MRCKNCGWLNEDSVSRCIKCNAPLQGSMIEPPQHSSQSVDNMDPLHATLREPSSEMRRSESAPSNNARCLNCGYPLSVGAKVCPNCQKQISDNHISNVGKASNPMSGNNRGTINPWSSPTEDSFCTLKKIPWQKEQINYDPVSFSGQSIVLNRANTDVNNNSITSKAQAILTHENGDWFIENQSELQTTLIRVDRKLKLQDGDVIVLGNRMFEFKKY